MNNPVHAKFSTISNYKCTCSLVHVCTYTYYCTSPKLFKPLHVNAFHLPVPDVHL